MSNRRKGRRFELDIYNELKKEIPDISMSKWSGSQRDEPGDLYTADLLFELKRINSVSDNQIAAWYKKTEEEAKSMNNRIPLLLVKEDFRNIYLYYNLKYGYVVDVLVRIEYRDFIRLYREKFFSRVESIE